MDAGRTPAGNKDARTRAGHPDDDDEYDDDGHQADDNKDRDNSEDSAGLEGR